MPRNTSGGGAQTTANGLAFERDTSFNDALGRIDDYELQKYQSKDKKACKIWGVKDKDGLVGWSAPQTGLERLLSERFGVEMDDVLSKRLRPDEAFMNVRDKCLYVIEKKYQERAGSVDEKLQTCDFKRREYEKLQKAANSDDFETVKYIYVLSPWFEQQQYDDVKEYIKDVGCDYYMGEIPLDALGL